MPKDKKDLKCKEICDPQGHKIRYCVDPDGEVSKKKIGECR